MITKRVYPSNQWGKNVYCLGVTKVVGCLSFRRYIDACGAYGQQPIYFRNKIQAEHILATSPNDFELTPREQRNADKWNNKYGYNY